MLVSVMGAGISFLSPIFGTIGRWMMFAVLLAYLSFGRKARLNTTTVLVASAYVVWCLLTSAWSEQPSLSLMKAIALGLALSASLWGGYHWGSYQKASNALGHMWPYAAVSLVAGLTGRGGSQIGSIEALAGATQGPNFLGFILATSAPVLLWQVRRHWRSGSRRVWWIMVLAFCLLIVYQTASRSALLVVAAAFAGFLAGIGVRRIAVYAVGAVIGIGLVASMATQVRNAIIQRSILKGATADRGVFYSREAVWADSFAAAILGGWFGVGYGVSAGWSTPSAQITTSVVGYGREKGNSQMAMIEETGVIGLLLSFGLLTVVFRKILAGFREAQDREEKILLGIIGGTLVGLVVQSMLEAWWGAPGAPEFAVFWTLAGVGLAVARRNSAASVSLRSLAEVRLPSELILRNTQA